jgi:alkyl hydroperoxide reductase subunit AhpC
MPRDASTTAGNQTVRNVCVVGPDKKIKLTLVYMGCNIIEVLSSLAAAYS